MALQIYRPQSHDVRCAVTITSGSFRFSSEATNRASLGSTNWMRIYIDPDDRLVVFEPTPDIDKPENAFKFGRPSKSGKTVITKKLIADTPWIAKITALSAELRRFEMKPYPGNLPPLENRNAVRRLQPWYIQLMPAFEESINPSDVKRLSSNIKGIYRYRGGDNGEEIVYIGKGSIKDRFEKDNLRREWKILRIEYSVLQGDDSEQRAYEWESWWIDRFKKDNNGRRPRFNLVDGHKS